MIAVTKEYCDRLLVTIREKDAEIERLEAALDEIISAPYTLKAGDNWTSPAQRIKDIARAARSEKDGKQ